MGTYEPQPFHVVDQKGSMDAASNGTDNVTRNLSFFRKLETADEEREIPRMEDRWLPENNSGANVSEGESDNGECLRKDVAEDCEADGEEGAQFKKEVVVDGQSHLLLIREEAEAPDAKFASWVDAVILVFSLENEGSFQDIFQYYTLLANYRGVSDIVVALVGTQDKINSNNKRVVDDARARALCGDMKRCMYYETCATYGLNVDRVFNEVAQKIVTLKKQQQLLASCKSLPSSPSHSTGSTPVSGVHSGQVTWLEEGRAALEGVSRMQELIHARPFFGAGNVGGCLGSMYFEGAGSTVN